MHGRIWNADVHRKCCQTMHLIYSHIKFTLIIIIRWLSEEWAMSDDNQLSYCRYRCRMEIRYNFFLCFVFTISSVWWWWRRNEIDESCVCSTCRAVREIRSEKKKYMVHWICIFNRAAMRVCRYATCRLHQYAVECRLSTAHCHSSIVFAPLLSVHIGMNVFFF